MEESYSFGAWLKQRRKVLDLTQAELARRVGCATVTLQKIELDERRPSVVMAERLAEVLGVRLAERLAFLQSARGDLTVDRLAVDASSGGVPAPRPRHNLPAQLTSFIAREREVSLALALLQQEDVRLLTLTGPGGTGKTRLSLRIVAELLDVFSQWVADGVWFVDLASIRDAAVVPSAIASVLGVHEAAGRSVRESLQAYLVAKQMLLVLDNFEQVITAGSVVADLLSAAPRLKVLVTSRSVLGVYGEQTFPVPPLGLPDQTHEYPESIRLEQLKQTEAVALFLARARAANPDFALTVANAAAVAEICRRLDGLPLAIELAAARSRLLTPQALLQRLHPEGTRSEDIAVQRALPRGHPAPGTRGLALLTGGPCTLPNRQQTLRNTIDWSYDLLTPAEQILFRRLAVFAGGWTLQAAEAVCTADDILPSDVLDGVASLGDKSLLRVGTTPDGEPRFSMLETIREYVLELLGASGEEPALRERHTHYYLQWLESMHDQYWSGAEERLPTGRGGPHRGAVIDDLRAEVSNLAATIAWITDQGGWVLALRWDRATASFGFVERLGGLSPVWKRWHQELTESRGTVSERSWAAGHVVIGRLAYFDRNLPQAAIILEAGLTLARTLDDSALINEALEWLGHAYRDQDRYARAIPLYEELLARVQTRGAPYDIASAHHIMGELALLLEDYPRALAEAQAGLGNFRALGVEWGIACTLINQGFAALHLGNDDLAARCFPEALRIAQLYDGGSHIRGALAGFVAMAARGGARGTRRAARLLGAIDEGWMVHAHRRACERILAVARTQIDQTLWEAAYAEGQRMTLEQAIAYALAPEPEAAGQSLD